jgi:hypothetical protein
MENLIELEDAIEYAREAAQEALSCAEDMADACCGEWGEINILSRKLSLINRLLKDIIPSGIQSTLNEARREFDRLADQADANNY